MDYWQVYIFIFCVAVFVDDAFGFPQADIQSSCEKYTQCRQLARTDERLCMGNSRSMPFWLPPANQTDKSRVAYRCHKELQNYYQQLDKLEAQQNEQLLSCLVERAMPVSFEKMDQCSKTLVKAENFTGDPMQRVPVRCFQGVAKRIENECSMLRECCSSSDACLDIVNEIDVSQQIGNLRTFIKDYARRCELGLVVELSRDFDDEPEHQPTGNITVTFHTSAEREHVPSPLSEPEIDPNERFLHIRVSTADEQLRRLEEDGFTREAEKLKKEINRTATLQAQGLLYLESLTTPRYPYHRYTEDEYDPPDDEPEELLPIQASSTLPPLVIPPRRDQFAENYPTRHQFPHRPPQTLIPLSSPDQPDDATTLKTGTSHPISKILKPFAKVPNIHRIVGKVHRPKPPFPTKNTTRKPENPTDKKIHNFFDTWEKSVRERAVHAANTNTVGDHEAALQYAKLLKTLNDLRAVLHKKEIT